MATQTKLGPGATFSFEAPLNEAGLLMAQTTGGVKLWAMSPLVLEDTVQNIDLRSTYQAALILASLGATPPAPAKVNALKLKADRALNKDVDRLVKTVERVIDNVLLKRIDYSPTTEVSAITLRAFGGGLEPVRSLDAVVGSPESDFFPYIYATQMTGNGNRLVMTEIKAERWDYRVVGAYRFLRLASGTNPARFWANEVEFTYTPEVDTALRDRGTIDLCHVDVEYRPFEQEKTGGWEGKADWSKQRRELLAQVREGRSLIV